MARNSGMFSRAVVVILPVLLILPTACSQRITEQGKRQLRSAAKLIELSSYSDAKDELGKFLQTYPQSAEASEAYYMLGLCRVYANQPEQAQDDFQSALAIADVPVLQHYVRLSLANLAFERQDYSTATEYYGTYFDDLPRRAPFHRAYFRYGLALQATGRWKQADVQFARVSYLFPQANILPAAQKHFGKTHYAIELGRFSSFRQADRQRRQFQDLPGLLRWQVRWGPKDWSYINLYGEFADLAQAQQALEKIKPRLARARIVPASTLGRRGG